MVLLSEFHSTKKQQPMGKILEAILNLFKTLFGGGSSSGGNQGNKPKPIHKDPQDGSEIKKDTIVVVADEMETIQINPEVPDVEIEEVPTDDKEAEAKAEEQAKEDVNTEPEKPPTTSHTPRYLWCLDNGHGKLTAGKRSPVFDDGKTQFLEYEFNRDIVLRIIAQLKEKGILYFDVVPDVEEQDNFLEGRVARANAKKSDIPKIFVSVHSNAAPAPSSKDWASDSISGIETWYFHNSKRGQKIASIFQRHLLEKTGWKNRHIKSRPNSQFYVLRKTAMTSVLTENGFYNNKAQALELMKDDVRQAIADAHVAAIVEVEENGL